MAICALVWAHVWAADRLKRVVCVIVFTMKEMSLAARMRVESSHFWDTTEGPSSNANKRMLANKYTKIPHTAC
jgi:hypothetical protein